MGPTVNQRLTIILVCPFLFTSVAVLSLQSSLPALDNPISFRVRGILSQIQEQRQYTMKVRVMEGQGRGSELGGREGVVEREGGSGGVGGSRKRGSEGQLEKEGRRDGEKGGRRLRTSHYELIVVMNVLFSLPTHTHTHTHTHI